MFKDKIKANINSVEMFRQGRGASNIMNFLGRFSYKIC